MKMFVIEKAKVPYKLIKLDLTKAETFLPPEPVKLGTATNENLKSLHVSNEVKLKFRKDCLRFLKAKITRKIPFKKFLYHKCHMSITHFYGHWTLRQPSYILPSLLKSFIRWIGCQRCQQKTQRFSVMTFCHYSTKYIATNFQNLIGK